MWTKQQKIVVVPAFVLPKKAKVTQVPNSGPTLWRLLLKEMSASLRAMMLPEFNSHRKWRSSPRPQQGPAALWEANLVSPKCALGLERVFLVANNLH